MAGYNPWGCKESDRTERLSMHTHRNCHHCHYVIRLWLPPVWLSCRHLEISCKWVCWWRRKIRPRDSTLLIRWELVCAWVCTHAWVNTYTTHTHTHTHTHVLSLCLRPGPSTGCMRNGDDFFLRAWGDQALGWLSSPTLYSHLEGEWPHFLPGTL